MADEEGANGAQPRTAGSLTALLSTLSTDEYRRGKEFERIAKWWLTHDPTWAKQVDTVWLWDEWPSRPGPDIGIDLVAQFKDGSLCAIQAKCDDHLRRLPKREIDSFIAASPTQTFAHRLLIATTDLLSTNARRTLAENQITNVLRSDLEASSVKWPTSIRNLRVSAQRVRAKPRKHQRAAIRDIDRGFREHHRGQLIMACGTGKTLTALWVSERLRTRSTLVLLPSLGLLSQTLSEWAANAIEPWEYLCVCSDETANMGADEDAVITTTGELPFEITTEAEAIAAFLRRRSRKVVFATYQSSPRLAEAQALTRRWFDLTIADEAHRLADAKDSGFVSVLDGKAILSRKRLFMTATPRIFAKSALTKAADRGADVVSMDDESAFGPVLHRLSFADAIRDGLLTDYRVLVVGVTSQQIADLVSHREIVSVQGKATTDARTLAAHVGLSKAMRDYSLRRVISFHSRVRAADRFAAQQPVISAWLPPRLRPKGPLFTRLVSGDMTSLQRRQLLRQFETFEGTSLLTNARCLTEGIDVPAVDGIAFVDPRRSQVDIVQAVGRAIRLSPDKELGTIIVPVLIDALADADTAIEDTAFNATWQVLNALRSHDEGLAAELDQLRLQLGKTGRVSALPSKIVEDLPADIDTLIPDFARKLALMLVRTASGSWYEWFGALAAYTAANGTSRPSATTRWKEYRIGLWVSNQRALYGRGLLAPDRARMLESLPGWTWTPRDEAWEQGFESLLAYSRRTGHALPPPRCVEGGYRVGQWVQVQRSTAGRKRLSSEQMARLEELPGWSWDLRADQWMQGLTNFKQFAGRNKHGLVPAQHREPNGFGLGAWVNGQRNRFNDGNMPSWQVEQLEGTDFWVWDHYEAVFLQGVASFKTYVQVHGTGRVPAKYVDPYGYKLGSFVNRNRTLYKQGKLQKDRVRILERLRGWTWDPAQDDWEQGYALLQRYVRAHGTSRVPQGTEYRGFKLGQWVSAQRTAYKTRRSAFPRDRIRRLEALPEWTWSFWKKSQ